MAYQGINTGTTPNDGTGDTLIGGGVKINSNFSELYNLIGDGSTLKKCWCCNCHHCRRQCHAINTSTGNVSDIGNDSSINWPLLTLLFPVIFRSVVSPHSV